MKKKVRKIMKKVRIKYTVDKEIQNIWDCPFNSLDVEERTYCNLTDKDCEYDIPDDCPARVKEKDFTPLLWIGAEDVPKRNISTKCNHCNHSIITAKDSKIKLIECPVCGHPTTSKRE